MSAKRSELGTFLKQQTEECQVGWYTNGNTYHNCKLPKRHKGNHRCVVKYRGTDIEAKCKSFKRKYEGDE